MERDIVIVRIWEGLGNQLFQYSYARALKENGIDVRLDLKKAYDETFEKDPRHDVRQATIQNFNIALPEIDVEKYGRYQYIKRDDFRNKFIFQLAAHGLWKFNFYEEYADKMGTVPQYLSRAAHIAGNYYIKGWFQDERYFRHIRKDLLRELTPKRKIKISQELRQVLENKESVSVHIRRGDYVKMQSTLDVRYYQKAFAFMKRQYREPWFLFFSDDLEWVKDTLNVGDRCIYVNEDRKLQDFEELFIMSKCKSNIIANSSFSWWGAWLNCNTDKIIIAPKGSGIREQSRMCLL